MYNIFLRTIYSYAQYNSYVQYIFMYNIFLCTIHSYVQYTLMYNIFPQGLFRVLAYI
jgi:hypothetical protein